MIKKAMLNKNMKLKQNKFFKSFLTAKLSYLLDI